MDIYIYMYICVCLCFRTAQVAHTLCFNHWGFVDGAAVLVSHAFGQMDTTLTTSVHRVSGP